MVEVLVAIVITAVLAIAVGRVITTTQSALTQSAGRSIAAAQALRFGDVLHYDLAGASDVYLFGATPPSDLANVCSSWTSTNGAVWNATNAATFVRPLFTITVPTVAAPASPTSDGSFLAVRIQRFGYEVRNEGKGYALIRIDCGATQRAQRLVDLGTAVPADLTGQTALHCLTADGTQITPNVAVSTMSASVPASQRCASFTFVLPDGAAPLLRSVAGPRLQRMSSEVTPT